jgi:serine/threonine-protein kinase
MDAAGPTWLTMELVDGGTVMRLTSLPDKLVALRQIADALDHTHRHGVVHCDVKPGNILIATDFASRGAVLVDFGVAHCVAPGVDQRRPSYVEASLPYAPPELLRGEPPSAASDEYALACTMVELLTGSPPFVANTAMRLVQRQLSAPPPRISPHRSWIPHAVDSILAKAMAKRPDQRYGSCAEFISLVAHALR